MESAAHWEMTKEEAAQLSAIIEECLHVMRRAGERMARDEEEFKRLRAETEAIIKREWAAM